MRAGSEVFASHGYEGASVEMIADEAGVNKAMINYHFGGKRGLHKAIMISTFDEVGRAVSALAATGVSAPKQLAAFLDTIAQIASTSRPAFPALFMRETLSADRVDPDVFPHVGVLIQTLLQVIARGIAEGSLRPVDPFCAYWTLLCPFTLYLATEATRKRARAEGLVPFDFPTPEQFLAQHKATVLRGLCSDKENA